MGNNLVLGQRWTNPSLTTQGIAGNILLVNSIRADIAQISLTLAQVNVVIETTIREEKSERESVRIKTSAGASEHEISARAGD